MCRTPFPPYSREICETGVGPVGGGRLFLYSGAGFEICSRRHCRRPAGNPPITVGLWPDIVEPARLLKILFRAPARHKRGKDSKFSYGRGSYIRKDLLLPTDGTNS